MGLLHGFNESVQAPDVLLFHLSLQCYNYQQVE